MSEHREIAPECKARTASYDQISESSRSGSVPATQAYRPRSIDLVAVSRMDCADPKVRFILLAAVACSSGGYCYASDWPEISRLTGFPFHTVRRVLLSLVDTKALGSTGIPNYVPWIMFPEVSR